MLVCLGPGVGAGAPWVVSAVAAHHDYGGPLIIIDFGTATTFDIIDTEGSYIGGVITPGINLSLDALHQSTALLPRISLRKPVNKSILGKSTVEAMNSGIYWGYVGLIDNIINLIKNENDRLAPGSDNQLFPRRPRPFF